LLNGDGVGTEWGRTPDGVGTVLEPRRTSFRRKGWAESGCFGNDAQMDRLRSSCRHHSRKRGGAVPLAPIRLEGYTGSIGV